MTFTLIEGGLRAEFWVWVEPWKWLRYGVVVLMLFCWDLVMGDGFGLKFDIFDDDGGAVVW